MKGLPKVLLVEDTTSLALVYREYLKDEPLELTHVVTGKAAMEIIAAAQPHLVLLDLKLPDMDGQEILLWMQAEGFPTAVVVITAHGSVDVAVDVMRAGAQDFLEKPFDAARLRTTVRNVLKQVRLEGQVDDLLRLERDRYHGFIGASLPMQAVYRIIDAAAPSKATVFITGESGTGKEVCAEAIHKQGPRANKPFIALNCGAIPHDLMESEIFGHVKGAFTGAYSERDGAASQADGGTLFLDEIGEMDLDLQTKLLRFVQTGRFTKVGGGKEKVVDVRFICATNRDPLAEVAAGRFREDLFYRLHVVPIHLPPLRDRGDDIMAIARHFLMSYGGEEGKGFRAFSPEVEVIFRKYLWPGNVRQLQNVIRNVVVLHDGDQVGRVHLPPPLDAFLNEADLIRIAAPGQTASAQGIATRPDAIIPLAQVERETIERAIALCNGNIPKAAALLEVSPSTIYRKKQSW
ncbi:MAG: sigma-54 dependent transcriptional regulator [Gammaproteobacteria bacterium]|nr:sigma-54 dependent transcriptional regulator [Gammaproteobacteria bacterium]MBU1962865.1 sigma-54 dependent transcriptional regulator [Gammaproteobacteria bacterium]